MASESTWCWTTWLMFELQEVFAEINMRIDKLYKKNGFRDGGIFELGDYRMNTVANSLMVTHHMEVILDSVDGGIGYFTSELDLQDLLVCLRQFTILDDLADV